MLGFPSTVGAPLKVVLVGSPHDPGSLVDADITSREMELGEAFFPLEPKDFETSVEAASSDIPFGRWYIRAGRMDDGTPKFVYIRLAPPRL